jgi:hypothetical protein
MNVFAVTWISDAEDSLTLIWLQTNDPLAVTRAQAQADALLARDPIGHGEHLSEGLYRLAVPPLTLYYTVDVAQRSVEVSEVRHTP